MSGGLMLIVVFYTLFSMLFSIMWTDSILNDYNFIDWYLDRLKNKNAFGKTYVTIFALFMLPSYIITLFCFFLVKVLQWIYDLGVKIDNEIEEVTE